MGLEVLVDRACAWGLAGVPVEPVRVGPEHRPVPASESSTVVRLRAHPQRWALRGTGYCPRAHRAVQANRVAALTTVVRLRGIGVGVGRRTRFGAPGQEAVAKVFTALPESPQKRLCRVEAGSATSEQLRAATEHEALVGRLRKNVTVRPVPLPPSAQANAVAPRGRDPGGIRERSAQQDARTKTRRAAVRPAR